MELLGYSIRVVLFLAFWKISILFSTVLAPTYISTSSVRGFPFFHILANTCYLCSFWWWPFWQVGEGNGTPLQYSCLENPMDGGAWWAAVHGVTKSRTRLSNFTLLFTFMHWRRKWQPTPMFLPGESQGRGSLVGCRLLGHTESDTTEVT